MKNTSPKTKKVPALGRIEKVNGKYVFRMNVPKYKLSDYAPRLPYKD